MKQRSAKNKGNRLERELAKRLREANLDKTAVRSPMSGAMETLKADILTNLPVSFECKNQERWSVDDYMGQAKAGAKQNELAIVVMSKNYQPEPYAVLELKDLIQLMIYAKAGGWTHELMYSKRRQLNR